MPLRSSIAPGAVGTKVAFRCPYPIAGSAYLLPNGLIFAFASVFDFNPNNNSPEPYPKDTTQPQTGAVSAVLIDLKAKRYTPIFRPKGNALSTNVKPLQGNGVALAQRAFARSLQLRDGRIVRIGGRVLYLTPAPSVTCKDQRCRYCTGSQCTPHPDGDYVCKEAKECPKREGKSEQIVLKLIEIYTPPLEAGGTGSVKRIYMDEGRRNTAAVELVDGRVFITGGKGPLGEGKGGVFRTTYLLDPNTGEMRKGPPMIIGREDHSMALLNDGRVLITGGSSAFESSINVTEIFDPKSEQLIDGVPMDLTREDAIPVYLGPWVLFLGGEDSGKSDLIRNSGEAFDVNSGVHVTSFFLYARESPLSADKLCPNSNGFAGIDDFAAIALDRTHVLLLGGQQGCQGQRWRLHQSWQGNEAHTLHRIATKLTEAVAFAPGIWHVHPSHRNQSGARRHGTCATRITNKEPLVCQSSKIAPMLSFTCSITWLVSTNISMKMNRSNSSSLRSNSCKMTSNGCKKKFVGSPDFGVNTIEKLCSAKHVRSSKIAIRSKKI